MASLQNTTITGSKVIDGALTADSMSISTSLQISNHTQGLRMHAGGQSGNGNTRTINGFTYKHLGQFAFNTPGRYFDARTNLSAGSLMFMFHVAGYLYSNGNIISWAGGYSYDGSGPDAIINKFYINRGPSHINNTYRSGGKLCIKCDRFSTGYTVGHIDIFFHSHDTNLQNAAVVEAFAINNTAGNHF